MQKHLSKGCFGYEESTEPHVPLFGTVYDLLSPYYLLLMHKLTPKLDRI